MQKLGIKNHTGRELGKKSGTTIIQLTSQRERRFTKASDCIEERLAIQNG
jgi:hypothetical protein